MYGRTLLANNRIQPTRVSSDGQPEYKTGGVTLDLTTIPAAPGTDTTLPDGSFILAGEQFMRYGQVICKITATASDLVSLTGSPAGGTITVNVATTVPGQAQVTNTATWAYNATAATVKAALEALANVGANNTTVTGSAGGPWTIVFADAVGAVTLSMNTNGLTGGTSPNATFGSTAPGGDLGMYGPYDPAATDGRQTLTRGQCFILDELWLYYESGSKKLSAPNNVIGGVIEGGNVFYDRLMHSGVAAHSLAAGPTLAELLAAFPRLRISPQD